MSKKYSSTLILTSVLQSDNLSLKERGLLAYLLSLDENKPISKISLVSKSSDGKDSIFSTFDGLVRKGFLKEIPRHKADKGRFTSINYTIQKQIL